MEGCRECFAIVLSMQYAIYVDFLLKNVVHINYMFSYSLNYSVLTQNFILKMRKSRNLKRAIRCFVIYDLICCFYVTIQQNPLKTICNN